MWTVPLRKWAWQEVEPMNIMKTDFYVRIMLKPNIMDFIDARILSGSKVDVWELSIQLCYDVDGTWISTFCLDYGARMGNHGVSLWARGRWSHSEPGPKEGTDVLTGLRHLSLTCVMSRIHTHSSLPQVSTPIQKLKWIIYLKIICY